MTNFIFIVADDLGYADLGCYGGRAPVSPRLDALAARGLRFAQGYSNSPVCSPTRFAMITGRYQYRLRGAAEEPMTMKFFGSTEIGLPPTHPTMPSLLKAAGYRTALIGKWHLGYPPHFGPLKSGYDEHFGPLSGGVSYFNHKGSNGERDLWENGERVSHDGQYLTDLISDRSAAFVAARARDQAPFLLSVHYTAPHWPWQSRDDAATSADVDRSLYHLDGGSIAKYQQMIREMDEGIGRIVDALEAGGLLDDTLLIFTSDNGGERFSDNWPLVGGKMDLTEGGIRVPYIVHWPRAIPAGTVTAQQAITMDWMATMLDIAGVPAHPACPLDGMSLLAVLRNPATTIPRKLYWRMKHRTQRALRDGDWKYLKVDEHEYLFDVVQDARERANRAKREPERLAAMRNDWLAWNATMGEIPEAAKVSLVYGPADMPSR